MTKSELLARLEAATEGSPELDGYIAKLEGWTFLKMERCKKPYWRRPGDRDWFSRVDAPPSYTRSLDAALTLVPEGWYGSLPIHRNCDAWLRASNDAPMIYGRGQTMALSLCIAALKARTE